MAAEFDVNDYVFARVRGYPPWPARISAILDPRPAHLKYKVYFFGTAETAQVTSKEIFHYDAHKDKMGTGKVTKRKGFSLAVQQLEAQKSGKTLNDAETAEKETDEPSAPKTTAPVAKAVKRRQSDATGEPVAKKGMRRASAKEVPEDNAKEPESAGDVAPTKRTSRRASAAEKEKPTRKRKTSEAGKPAEKESDEADVPIAKRRRSAAPASEATEPTKSDVKEQVTSRSGRVIKPKKFLDSEAEANMEAKTGDAPAASPEKIPKKSNKDAGKSSPIKEDIKKKGMPAPPMSPMGRLKYTRHKSGQLVQVHLDYETPDEFKNNQHVFKKKCDEFNKQLIEDIENGEENLPQHVLNQLKDESRGASDSYLSTLERTRGKARWMDLENEIDTLNVSLQQSLQKDKIDPEKALTLLDDLYKLPIDPLMLKKKPNIVDTITKLTKFTGPATNGSKTDPNKKKYLNIRTKAEKIINKFRASFLVPRNKDFWKAFKDSVAEFEIATKEMEKAQIQALTCDPSSELFKDVVAMDQEDAQAIKVALEDEKGDASEPLQETL